jgi:hypothetical protein
MKDQWMIKGMNMKRYEWMIDTNTKLYEWYEWSYRMKIIVVFMYYEKDVREMTRKWIEEWR